jgi:hypothetical protein
VNKNRNAKTLFAMCCAGWLVAGALRAIPKPYPLICNYFIWDNMDCMICSGPTEGCSTWVCTEKPSGRTISGSNC